MHKYYNNFLHPPHFSLTYNRFNQYPNKAPTIDGNFAYASLTAAGRLQHFAFNNSSLRLRFEAFNYFEL
jgi:hypothetical protein